MVSDIAMLWSGSMIRKVVEMLSIILILGRMQAGVAIFSCMSGYQVTRYCHFPAT